MGMYNISSNMTQLIDLLPFVNGISGGYLGYIIVIMVAAISLVITASFNIRDSHIASAFITTIVAMFLWILNLVDSTIFFVCIIFLVLATVASMFGKGSEGA